MAVDFGTIYMVLAMYALVGLLFAILLGVLVSNLSGHLDPTREGKGDLGIRDSEKINCPKFYAQI